MKVFVVLGLLVAACVAQEILEVTCGQDAITARFDKKVAETADYGIDDLHFASPDCKFDEDDGGYYIKRIEPLLSCGTIFTTNDTHVTYFNSISTGDVETGLTYPHGIIVGQPENEKIISVSLSCTYKIDLRVSAAFIPNITYVYIPIPDVEEFGRFKVGMQLYRTGDYRDPYGLSPVLEPDQTVYVGVGMLEETSPDVHLLLQRCWATVFEDPDSDPYYDLITESCPREDAVQGSVVVKQNGEGHQALWEVKVFRFVGKTDDYKTVWLHCDVTLCIKRACKPTCEARRKRSIDDELQMSETRRITVGPVNKMDISLLYGEEGVESIIINNNTRINTDKVSDDNKGPLDNSLLIIIGALAAFCLLCLTVALVIVVMRLKRSNGGDNSSVTTTGTINKGFSI